ncbi:MAG TPA: hypothetical protein VEP73_00520, partial [Actinomycetota bacterium]|nr:hypothetical protein [Actinomycetota bacterium]
MAACLGCLLTVAVGVTTMSPAVAGGSTRTISSSGSTSFSSRPSGSDTLQWPELAGGDAAEEGAAPYDGTIVNRSYSHGTAKGPATSSARKAKSNPELVTSFDGLTLRQQRLANGGNQFTVEPPDQGLCVGNGYVLESVNSVLNVYGTSGDSKLGVVDLNSFYGYPAQFNRTT